MLYGRTIYLNPSRENSLCNSSSLILSTSYNFSVRRIQTIVVRFIYLIKRQVILLYDFTVAYVY